jgi:hypothetical protein
MIYKTSGPVLNAPSVAQILHVVRCDVGVFDDIKINVLRSRFMSS